MDPGQAVSDIVRDLALQGNYGASIEQVWEFARIASGQSVDEFLKKAFWKWLIAHPAVIVTNKGDPLPQHEISLEMNTLLEKYDVYLFAGEEEQYLALTGRPKQGNPVGPFPFRLLCAVSRSRTAGISSIDLNRQTGQDPRSIHGRVAHLADLGLVSRYPVIQNKLHTHLVVFHQYVDAYNAKNLSVGANDNQGHIDKTRLVSQILEMCKSGPNGIRLREDIFQQLGFASLKRGGPFFRSLLRSLEAKNYLRQIEVFEPTEPDFLYRCVQFVRDIEPEVDASQLESLDDLKGNAYDNDDDFDDIDQEDDDAQPSGSTSTGNAPDVGSMLMAPTTEPRFIYANLYYPIETQVFDVISNAGSKGLSAMSLYKRLTGPYYTKALSRLLDVLVSKNATKNGQPVDLGYLGLVRGIDFVARMKFYRYFTQVMYHQFTGRPIDPKWGEFPKLKKGASSLRALNTTWSKPLPGSSGIIETESGQIKALFHGDKPAASSKLLLTSETETVKKRGRPRKTPAPEPEPRPSAAPIQRPTPKEKPVASRTWTGGSDTALTVLDPILTLEDSIKDEPMPDAPVSLATPPQSQGPAQGHASAPASNIEAPAIKAEPAGEERPTASTNGLNSLNGPNGTMDIASAKRQDDILQIVAEQGGVTEGGISLNRRLNELQGNGITVDRKTMARAIARLVASGRANQVFVSAPTSRGIVITRYLIHDPALNIDDPKIVAVKKRITEGICAPTALGPIGKRTNVGNAVEAPIELMSSIDRPRRFRALAEATQPRTKTAKPKTKFGPKASDVPIAVDENVPDAVEKRRGRPRGSKKAETQSEKPPPVKRKRENADTLDETVPIDAERLFRAVVISRSLYSKGTSINWDMVVEGVPGLSASRARKRWPAIRDGYGGTDALAKATEAWERLFVHAYQNDELDLQQPSQDDFTLQKYIDFWSYHAGSSLFSNAEHLTSRTDFERRNGLIKKTPLRNPLDTAFTLPSMIRVEELMANVAFTVPDISLETAEAASRAKPFTIDENLVRSIIASDEARFSPETSAKELLAIGEERAKTAIDNLVASKVAHYIPRDAEKTVPGRNYGLSDRVIAGLAVKMDELVLEKSESYIKEIPDQYAVPSTIEDTAMVPLLELVANGDIKLKRENAAMGRLISDYRSRMIEKNKLECDVSVEVESRPQTVRPDVDVPTRSTPYIWQTETVSPLLWKRVVTKVLLLVVARPHIPLPMIQVHMRPSLTSDEVSAVVQWLVKTGRIREDNGYVAEKFWFQ